MPLPPDVLPLVRNFNNNSFRYLFKHAENVADLVGWRKPKIAPHIDFHQLVVEPDSFITPGFAELESDILLRAPFRLGSAEAGEVLVYLLMEHLCGPPHKCSMRI